MDRTSLSSPEVAITFLSYGMVVHTHAMGQSRRWISPLYKLNNLKCCTNIRTVCKHLSRSISLRSIKPLLVFVSFAAYVLLSTSTAFASTHCPGSPTKDTVLYQTWNNCIGEITFGSGTKLIGKFRDGILFDGKRVLPSGKVMKVGNGYSKKSRPSSPLRTGFVRLPEEKRKLIQSELKVLRLYSSTVDGLYGKGTENALRRYNSQYAGNADLTSKSNVATLYADILKSQPNTEDTATIAAEPAETEKLTEQSQTLIAEATTAAKEVPKAKVTTDTMLASFERQEYLKANTLAQELAADGDATAQFYLGLMFAEGLGTLQISKSAHMWFNIASLNGSPEATSARNSIAETMSQTAVEEAQEMALLCIQSKYADCGLIVRPKTSTKATQTTLAKDGTALRNNFNAQTALRRKQLQYALKKLGVYSSIVDGLWGKNTSNAFTNYIKINSEEAANADALFENILSKVVVPTQFEVPKKQKPKSTVAKKAAPKTYSAPRGWTTFTGNPQMSYEQAKAICKPIADNAWDRTAGVQYDTTYNCNVWGSNSVNCRSYSGPSSAAEGLAAGLATGFAKAAASKRAFSSCMAQYGWKKK